MSLIHTRRKKLNFISFNKRAAPVAPKQEKIKKNNARVLLRANDVMILGHNW
jgi:hypothetical protein